MSPPRSDPGPLALPQTCTKDELARRQREIEAGRKLYQFDHSWKGYPPFIERVPLKEVEGLPQMLKAGFKLEKSKLDQWARRVEDELEHLGRKEEPFEKYTALYEADKLPEIGKGGEWQEDSVFAAQRLNGMCPWFIERLGDLAAFRKGFPITEAMLAGVLPEGATLEGLQAAGRLYVVSQASLDGATPAHGHVMTAPTTLFWVNNAGALMPLGIQLHPQASETNPVFTPNDDPNTWLAAKIHAGCADGIVHSLYSHSTLLHFVMSNVWTSLNRALPSRHPIHAFLKPHFWGTLLVTAGVKGSMDGSGASQCEVFGTGFEGQNQMVSRLYANFDFRDYDPTFELRKRGVDDPEKLPGFYFRDDALRLWEADHEYVEEMMGLFYESDDDVKNDLELQAWMADLASAQGAGIEGLPVNAAGRMETREQLHRMLTTVLYTVTSRHSSAENGALRYLYIPANPGLYRLAAPKTKKDPLELRVVSDELPPIHKAIAHYALIASVDLDARDFGLIGRYPDDFMAGSPAGVKAIVGRWNAALEQIASEIDARNEKLAVPYTHMHPMRTFNSIWN